MSNHVYINAGGKLFTTTEDTIKRCSYFINNIQKELPQLQYRGGKNCHYFIDIDPEHFKHVLNLLRYGDVYNFPLELKYILAMFGIDNDVEHEWDDCSIVEKYYKEGNDIKTQSDKAMNSLKYMMHQVENLNQVFNRNPQDIDYKVVRRVILKNEAPEGSNYSLFAIKRNFDFLDDIIPYYSDPLIGCTVCCKTENVDGLTDLIKFDKGFASPPLILTTVVFQYLYIKYDVPNIDYAICKFTLLNNDHKSIFMRQIVIDMRSGLRYKGGMAMPIESLTEEYLSSIGRIKII